MERNIYLPFKDDDICFLPKQISSKEADNTAKWFLKNNKDYIEKELGEKIWGSFDLIEKLKFLYRSNYFNKENENFINSLPKKLLSYTAYFDAIMNEDPYCIIPEMKYTDFGYIILDNGIISDTIKYLDLQRLDGVKQLGFLMNPILRDYNLNASALGFSHTRGLHSLDVATVLRLIALNNKEANLDKNLLTIGGVTHDALTPAGSDTTKLVDLELFDEDIHYRELFKRSGWQKLKEIYKVSEDDLYKMILNKGIYGQLLDIADKIAYTSRDVWEFVGIFSINEDNPIRNDKYRRLQKLTEFYPKFCNIWKDVKIYGDMMVLENSFNLAIFLTIRALMFAELYYNPSSRFVEYMFSKRVINLLFKENIINKELLLKWKDYNLEEKIWEFLGNENFVFFPNYFEKSDYKTFSNENERNQFVEKNKDNESFVLITDDFKCVTKTGVDKYLVKKDGKIMTLREAQPEMSSEIERIMTFENNIGLYIVSLDDLQIPTEKRRYLKEQLERI